MGKIKSVLACEVIPKGICCCFRISYSYTIHAIITSCKLLNLPTFYRAFILNLNNFINNRNYFFFSGQAFISRPKELPRTAQRAYIVSNNYTTGPFIFCRYKFVGTPACRSLADFLSRLTAFNLGAELISAMFEKRLFNVTLMTISHRLRYARAPTNCLGPPHTSRQGPTRRFEI